MTDDKTKLHINNYMLCFIIRDLVYIVTVLYFRGELLKD